MNTEQNTQALEQILRQQVTCSALLLECLKFERDALSKRDMDELEKFTNDKLEHTQVLEQLELKREGYLSERGYSNDVGGMQQCCRALPQSDLLLALWDEIMGNIQACQASNMTNGGILELGRKHVEQALSILRGQNNTPSVYNTNGSTSPHLGQRELGKV